MVGNDLGHLFNLTELRRRVKCMLINLSQRGTSAHVSCLQGLLCSLYHLSCKEDAFSVLLATKPDVNGFQPIGSPPRRTPIINRSRLVRHPPSGASTVNSPLAVYRLMEYRVKNIVVKCDPALHSRESGPG
jgi:hypothetical protein